MTKPPENNSHSPSFETLASEFAQMLRQGESPDLDEFAKRNEALSTQVRRLFPVLEMMEQHGELDESKIESLIDSNPASFSKLNNPWEPPQRLGDYRLIREIGRGGMGIVYEAVQESLGRRVAIKILPTSAPFDRRRMERFTAEAKASAMMHHTNIVPVFGIGCESGLSFLVMQFIEGQPLNKVIRTVAKLRERPGKQLGEGPDLEIGDLARTFLFEEPVKTDDARNVNAHKADTIPSPLNQTEFEKNESTTETGKSRFPTGDTPGMTVGGSAASTTPSHSKTGDGSATSYRNYFRNVARAGVMVSQALDYAHHKGILHRDIKPANLLLDRQGTIWVSDFGLAKDFDSPDLTRTGEVVGTLRYMSPEQLEGNATLSSDIFGLGLTLYEMLTLQPAYPGVDRKRLIEKVTEANPPSPRSIDSRIPRDLETIVMKCIHSEPAKRYTIAAEVGRDLTRFLDGQPIQARRTSPTEKVWKWCRRRPALASLMAALVASIVLGVIGVGWQWRQTSAALAISQANFETAKRATIRAQQNSARAEKNFELARSAVVQNAESISHEEHLSNQDLLPVREKLLRKALEYQQEFVKNHPGNVEVGVELADAWIKLASVCRELTKPDEARQCLSDARAVLEPFVKRKLEKQKRERVLVCLAETYSLSGQIEMRASPDGQYDVLQAMRILVDGREERLLSKIELVKLAELHRRLGDAYTEQNISRPHPLQSLTEKALRQYTKSYELTESLSRSEPSNKTFVRWIAGDHRDIGMANRRLKNYDVAFSHYSASVDQFRSLVEAEPGNMDFRFGLAEALSSLAFYYAYAERDGETALANYLESIGEYQKLSKAFPSIVKFLEAEVKVTMNCCIEYERMNRSREATPLRQRTLELCQRALLFAPNDPRLRSSYAKALGGMSRNCTRLGERELAWKYNLQAREQHEKAVALAPDNPTYQIRLTETIIGMQFNLRAQRDFQGAHDILLEAIQSDNPDPDVLYMMGRSLLLLARRIKEQTPDVNPEELAIGDQAIESAKVVFDRLWASDRNPRERLLKDRKVKNFCRSQTGKPFLDWMALQERRLATIDEMLATD